MLYGRTTLKRQFSLKKIVWLSSIIASLKKIHIFSENFVKLIKLLWGHVVETPIISSQDISLTL